MISRLLRASLAAACLVLAAASPADMSGLVGATVLGSTPDKVTRRIQLHADGTYRITLSDGTVSSGRWSQKDDQLCYDRVDPPPPPGGANPFCVSGFAGHKVGDRWTLPWRNGGTMTLSVVAGQ